MTVVLSPRRLLLLVQAVLSLLAARLLLAALPFSTLARLLGSPTGGAATHQQREPIPDPRVNEIGWAVRAAASRVPWLSTCLVQALATAGLLAARNIEYRLLLGLSRAGGGMQAHAWVCSGERVVVGAAGHKAFTPVASFSRQRRTRVSAAR